MEKFIVKDVQEGSIYEWSMEDVLSEINRDRSDKWTPYDESDWEEGWNEWCEGDIYTLVKKPHTMIVKNDYTDEQNFTHIDAWVDDSEEGMTIAIVCRDTKKVYFAENMYRDEPMVLTAISEVLESLK